MPLPIVALIGRPNVGKSTLFNRIVGRKRAIISEVSGTTRDRMYLDAEWNGVTCTFVDMGGVEQTDASLDADMHELSEGIQAQVHKALSSASVCLFMFDARDALTSIDRQVADMIRKSGKKVIVVANKVDNEHIEASDDLLRLGFGEPCVISALHGRGVAELLDRIIEYIRTLGPIEMGPKKSLDEIAIAIVGKPNVGKSSIVNKLIGDERVLVSPVPGTTRDSTDIELTYKKTHITLIDTAGMRRQAKVERQSIEHFSVMRTQQSIDRCDIVVHVLDVTDDISHQDEAIVQLAMEAKRGLVMVVNKWDLVDKDEKTMVEYSNYLHKVFDYLTWAPILFVSALDGQRVRSMLDTVLEVHAQQCTWVDPAVLNNLIRHLQSQQPPGYSHEYGSLQMFSAKQVSVHPPVFEIMTNAPQEFKFAYRRFLEKQLRKKFGLQGAFIQLQMAKRRDGE